MCVYIFDFILRLDCVKYDIVHVRNNSQLCLMSRPQCHLAQSHEPYFYIRPHIDLLIAEKCFVCRRLMKSSSRCVLRIAHQNALQQYLPA